MRTLLAVVALTAILFSWLAPDRAAFIRTARRSEADLHRSNAARHADGRKGEEKNERMFFNDRVRNPYWRRTVAICRLRAKRYAATAAYENRSEQICRWGADHPFRSLPKIPPPNVRPDAPLAPGELEAEMEAMRSIEEYR